MTENYTKMSVAQVGEALGKDRSTVHRWKKAGMPINPDGKTLSLPLVVDWLIQSAVSKIIEQHEADLASDGDNPHTNRWRAAHADLEELKRDRFRETVIDKDDIMREWVERLHIMRAALFSLPGKFSTLLVGREGWEIYQIVDDVVNHLMVVYSRHDKFTPDVLRDLGSVEEWLAMSIEEQQAEIERIQKIKGLL